MEEAEPFPADWTPNMRANLVFLTRGDEVLLIHKKTGLGAGKINGPGGKLEPGETAIEAARREVREELQIEVGELEKMGELHFDFVDGLKLHCVVFRGTEFTGTPTETREAKPEWFPIADLPLDRMWADDRHWLPQMLLGQRFQAWFRFDGEVMLTREVKSRSGVSPLVDGKKRRDAASTFFNPYAPIHITKSNLPHWHQEGASYFVTFRLVDSMPQEKLRGWIESRDEWLCSHPEPVSEEDWAEYYEKFSARFHDWLDQGSGSCILAIPECRSIVENALAHFDGERYDLGERVVAANHAHVLVTARPGHDLSEILHSWKSFTAKELAKVEAASRRLQPWWDKQSKGDHSVWQKESFDHLVRSPESLYRFECYIRDHREWEE
jgi:mutator protein MutT